jgi:hypothetical protein
MKTVFKVGMEVYDNIFFPNSKGEVVRIDKHIDCERVIVQFDCLDYELSYTEKGRLTSTYNGATPTLSTKPYTLQGFEQKAPAPTYDEIRAESLKKGEYVTLLNGIELPDERVSNAFKALAKLIWLRDYYNEGWQPDWNINKVKYIIKRHGNRHFSNIETSENHPSILYFKSKEIRDKFLKEQKELLEIAKPLL